MLPALSERNCTIRATMTLASANAFKNLLSGKRLNLYPITILAWPRLSVDYVVFCHFQHNFSYIALASASNHAFWLLQELCIIF